MAWRQVTIALNAADIDRAESLLRLAGATAITLGDDGDDPVLEPPPGAVELWPRVRLTALFDQAVPVEAMTALIGESLDVDSIAISELAEQDWIGGWQQAIEPIVIAPELRVIPADAPPAADPDTAVLLNMGLAFGTGRHPTTRLCLEWIATAPVSGQRVLDYGCGSGVLALAALKRGAAFALATDNDEQALVATRANAGINGMLERFWIGPPEALPDGTVDVLLANILAGTLREFAATFAALQTAGGRIVLSGVLTEQVHEVTDAFAAHYRDFVVTELDGWLRIVATHR